MSLTRHALTIALITTSLALGDAPLRATDADLAWVAAQDRGARPGPDRRPFG